jgi:hypothetical protein
MFIELSHVGFSGGLLSQRVPKCERSALSKGCRFLTGDLSSFLGCCESIEFKSDVEEALAQAS